jgi:hypothetical protein
MDRDDVRIGSTVTAVLMTGDRVTAKIEYFDEKNGRPLADLDSGNWVYLESITRVVKY